MRPDRITVIPWSRGNALFWDTTCNDSFAPSNLSLSSARAGAVADGAATTKCQVYIVKVVHLTVSFPLPSNPLVFLVVMLQMFYHALVKHYRTQTCDTQAYLKLCPQIRITVQSFNCTAILDSNVFFILSFFCFFS